jgi:hypothetical protein
MIWRKLLIGLPSNNFRCSLLVAPVAGYQNYSTQATTKLDSTPTIDP